jgi:site-specific DNA-methyltransferase (adenine-specific)
LELLTKFTQNAIDACKYVFVNIQVLSGNKKAFIGYLSQFEDKFCDVAVWDKLHAAPAAAQRVMDSRFEFVFIFGGNGSRAIGTRDFRGMVHNVYSGNPQRHNDNADIHAATFPIDFPDHFIKTFTNDNEIIFDPFLGTGTTMVACQNLNRKCRAIEISPNYCAVILERMSTAFPELEISRVTTMEQ